ncbi:hypothetical protein [Fluviispira multicolorata]|uniref:Uncharacterized protein n=1 Tax=Fluviispira multicolorata TaxID=2654512 RepID=A0A833JG72_9BACT|nr:hypothetical protein [Fluviispira multicolorata]KAB8033798.1 hypothetical protein GCL57_03560 [Fluviispira multicolorata]
MTKISKVLLILGLLVAGISAFVFNKKTEKKQEPQQLTMITKIYNKETGKVEETASHSPENYFGTISFLGGEPNSKNMAQAIFCADQIAEIEKVDLYMPDMGHGSQPPTVAEHKEIPALLKDKAAANPYFGCLHISSMQLFMPGLWQVRAFYKNDTVGIIDITLKD